MTQRWRPPTDQKAGPDGPTPQKEKSKSAPKEEHPAPDTPAAMKAYSALEPWKAAHLIAQRDSVQPTDTYLAMRKQLFPRPTDKD